MTAKTKWPEKVWVQKWDSGSLSAHRVHMIAGKDSMRYRPDRGNEVVKAMNLIVEKPNYASVAWVEHVLNKLNKDGIRIRWSMKRGKFV